jgi:glucosamine 6-phosphate synthetase-like amidotransferase/phosphosugar isomerase protein
MHDAVLGQPDAIAQVLDAEKNAVSELVEIVAAAERVRVVGIGTSWHAALVGEYLLRIVGGERTHVPGIHSSSAPIRRNWAPVIPSS